MADYYLHRGVRRFPHFDTEAHGRADYQESRHQILKAGREGPVFFKDMSFYVLPEIGKENPKQVACRTCHRKLTIPESLRDVLLGYYGCVSMVLNAFEVPQPEPVLTVLTPAFWPLT